MNSTTKSAGVAIGVVTLFVSFFASPDATFAWGDEVVDGGCCGYGYSDIYPEDTGFGYSDIYPETDYGYSDIYPTDYGYSDIYPNEYGYADIYPNDYGYSDIYPSYYGSSDIYPSYGSYSYPSYSGYGYSGSYGYSSSYPVSVGYGVPVGYSGGNYSYPVSYSQPITVATGRPVAHPTTMATPTTIATVDNSVNIVDNSINDSFNTTTIMNSFNNGSGAATHHPTPSCSIYVTGTFGYGQTLTWHTYNANSASISSVGAVTTGYGTRVVYPTHGQIYTMTVSGAGGTANCQTSAYNYVAPVTPTYPTYPTAPYVALTQIPYTGFDFGPIGNSLYWAALLSIAAAGAYLVVYYRGGVTNLFARSDARAFEMAPAFASVAKPQSILADEEFDDAAIKRSAQDRVTRDAMSIDLSLGVPRLVIARQ